MSTENKFYVYEHWRSDTNVCFYVGKGQKRRAWDMNCGNGTNSRNRWHKFLIKKLQPKGLLEVRIVLSDLQEAHAFKIERYRISYWRAMGIKLVNLTDGGDGASGTIVSQKTRDLLSKKLRGRKTTAEQRARMSKASMGNKRALGYKRKPHEREAISKRNLGKVMSLESRQKMRDAKLGRVLTDAHKAKIKASVMIAYQSDELRKRCASSQEVIERVRLLNTGRKQTAEHIAKKSAAIRGRKHSEATILLMRESQRRVRADKKEFLSASVE